MMVECRPKELSAGLLGHIIGELCAQLPGVQFSVHIPVLLFTLRCEHASLSYFGRFQVENVIEETKKYITLLQEHAGGNLETQLLAVQVYLRKGKFLKVLQAIKRAAKIASEGEPELHVVVVMFLKKLE